MRKSAKIMMIGTTVLLFLSVAAVQNLGAEEVKQKFEKILPLAMDGKVQVSNVSGNIEVMTWDRKEVKIDALKISRASSTALAKENADLVTIEIDQEDDTLKVKTEYHSQKGEKRSLNVSVHFKVTIPSGASAKISSVSGNIEMINIAGKAQANSISGDVSMEKISGDLKAISVSGDVEVRGAKKGAECESVSGDVEIEDVYGNIELKSVSGNIKADKIAGDVEAETISGNIILTDVSLAEEIDAETLSGNVKYSGDLNDKGRFNFKSHSGEIVLTIPADSRFDLEAKTFSGSLDSEFDIMISGKMRKTDVRGSVNGGGAQVELKTFSGGIVLKKK